MISCYFLKFSARTSLSHFIAKTHNEGDTFFFPPLYLLHFPSPHHLMASPPHWKSPKTGWIWMPQGDQKDMSFHSPCSLNRCTTPCNSESLRKAHKVCQQFLSSQVPESIKPGQVKGGWRYTKIWIGNCAADVSLGSKKEAGHQQPSPLLTH